MKLWRIAAETRTYPATDLSGIGAAAHPGRWNDQGEPIVYCATSMALAVLETVAHLDDSGFPQNRFIVEIDVPPEVWSKREQIAIDVLPPAWNAIPAGQASIKIGSNWLRSHRSPLLLVPSVIVPDETCVLINPSHPLASQLTAKAMSRFDYNRLFRER